MFLTQIAVTAQSMGGRVMPDLTIETYYVCSKAQDRMRYGGELMCDWHEFTHDEPVAEKDGEKVCPKCGGSIEVERWGV